MRTHFSQRGLLSLQILWFAQNKFCTAPRFWKACQMPRQSILCCGSVAGVGGRFHSSCLKSGIWVPKDVRPDDAGVCPPSICSLENESCSPLIHSCSAPAHPATHLSSQLHTLWGSKSRSEVGDRFVQSTPNLKD